MTGSESDDRQAADPAGGEGSLRADRGSDRDHQPGRSPAGSRSAIAEPERFARANSTSAPRIVAVIGANEGLGEALVQRLDRDSQIGRVIAIHPALDKGAQGSTRSWGRPGPGGLSWLRRASARDRGSPAPDRDPGRIVHHAIDLQHATASSMLARLLAGADAVVHVGFLPRPVSASRQEWAHEVESIGTLRVLDACASAAVPALALWSQSLVYGPHPDNPNYLSEQHPLRASAQVPYVAERLDIERQVRDFVAAHPRIVTTVLRTAPLLGVGLSSYAAELLTLPLCPRLWGRDPLLQLLHPEDAVEAFAQAVRVAAPGVFNIASRGVLPYGTVLALLGRPPLPLPAALAYPAAGALFAAGLSTLPAEFLDLLRCLCVMDIGKAERELGFYPRHDIQSTLRAFAVGARRSVSADARAAG